jgi:hypothetical protein
LGLPKDCCSILYDEPLKAGINRAAAIGLVEPINLVVAKITVQGSLLALRRHRIING